jgi:hypothetical protein
MKKCSPADRLLKVVQALAAEKGQVLECLKRGCAGLKRTDFVWHYLLQSFATMGRASGWHGLIENQENYCQITYEALASLSPKERKERVHRVCRAAKIRMPDIKAGFILDCFSYVKKLGGPERVKALLLAQPNREEKIKFLKTFRGIGPKYARNIMMDVYHKEFRESIAIDARIKSISSVLGLSFTDAEYAKHENFYLDVAHSAGLNGWELDRLLFNFSDEVKRRLDA